MSDDRHFDIQVDLYERRIVLSGDLDGSPEAYRSCKVAALVVANQVGHWIIDARGARLPRGGVEVWIAIVREYLAECLLSYLPCQLATNLKCDEKYDHENSVFLEAAP